jgi:EmrB/QacA subfamily drug resistance transporter
MNTAESHLNAASPVDDRTRWLALYVLCAGMLMIVLDATIVNVALPSIQDSLGFSQNNLAWVINAYMIPFGGLLLLAGRMGDLLGQRRVFLIGLTIFTVASLVCAASQSQEMLVGARFIQGLGGALASAVILGMIVTMFPEPGAQAKAIGVYGFVASAGGSIGLLLGGVLTTISWHWIFLINLPIGILTAYLARRLVANPDGIGLSEGADFPGAGLITVSLMLGVFTILKITEWGWVDARTLGLGAVSAALLAAFIHRQATIANPLMPLRLFRSRNVAGSNVLQALLVAGMFGMFFLGALYLQRVLGYSALQVGLAFLPTTLVMGTLSLGFSERLIMRFGPRTTLIPGVCLVVVALLLFATRTPVDGDYLTDLLPPFLLIGIGVGTSFPAIMTLAMSGATPSEAGLASGFVNTSMQVGGAIGLAVLATLSTQRSESLVDGGTGHLQALASGYHVAYFVGAGLAAIAAAIAIFVLRSPRPTAGTAPQENEPEPVLSEAG